MRVGALPERGDVPARGGGRAVRVRRAVRRPALRAVRRGAALSPRHGVHAHGRRPLLQHHGMSRLLFKPGQY